MKLSSTELMHLRKIMICITFLCFMYVVICLIVSVMIENIKIKTMFNSETEVNCMFKRLIDIIQLFISEY